jgi:predicted lipoprotein with Yx(FWY)xxD motif
MSNRVRVLALSVVFLSVARSAACGPAQSADTATGAILVDASGMSLYVFDNDTSLSSTCTGRCATHWPPLKATARDQADGDWGIITRDDGTLQWAYKRKPLYTWTADKKPGDIHGNGVNDSWHVAKP